MQEISTFTFKVISRVIDFSAEAKTFETLPPQKNYHFQSGSIYDEQKLRLKRH